MPATLTPIAVVGAGALGCLFGGMLARNGAAVTLIGRATHVEPIRRDGLVLERGGRTETIHLAATENMSAVRGAGLVLFCVKSTDTDAAARAMAVHLSDQAAVLSLQNGVDNVERIRAQIGAPIRTQAHANVRHEVFPGLVYTAAQMAGPGHVRHTGGGGVVIGQLAADRRPDGADRTLLDAVVSLFVGAGVAVRISDEVETELWTKLVMNCAYNAISALGDAPYGEMVALADVRTIMGEAVRETAAVAAAKGVRLPANIVDAAIKLADGMPLQISSTAQDIRRGRRTEIDHLNGYVVRTGETLGIATPVNRTLHALMKLRERRAASS
jgi:2-dehydropantoate 2-reductase